MQIRSIDYSQRIFLYEGETAIKQYMLIPGTSPEIANRLLLKKDKHTIVALINFLWSHAIDAYLRIDDEEAKTKEYIGNLWGLNKPLEYRSLEVMALARSEELFQIAHTYLNNEVTNPYPKGIRIGKVLYPLGMPAKINGPFMSVEGLENTEFKELPPENYLKARLNPITKKRNLRMLLNKHPRLSMVGILLPDSFYNMLDNTTPLPVDLTIVPKKLGKNETNQIF